MELFNEYNQFDKVENKCKFWGDRGHPSFDCPFKPKDEDDVKSMSWIYFLGMMKILNKKWY